MTSTDIGRIGENIAASYLQNQNYKIVTRNYRSAHGEIDIIAVNKETLVFIEVKSRTPASFHKYGSGKYAIDTYKRTAFLSAVKTYLYRYPSKKSKRIDVIEVTFNNSALTEYQIHHFKNAFGEQSAPYSYRKF